MVKTLDSRATGGENCSVWTVLIGWSLFCQALYLVLGWLMFSCALPFWVSAGQPVNASELVQGSKHAGANKAISYRRYVNPRFKYGIDYPTFLIAGRESDNGSGRKFTSLDKNSELTVYGMSAYATIDGEKLSVRKALEDEIGNRRQQGDKVTYRSSGDNWLVISGYRRDKVFYFKMIIDEDNAKSFELIYPTRDKTYYDKIVKHVAWSFKNTL